jgi:hypothetical protein
MFIFMRLRTVTISMLVIFGLALTACSKEENNKRGRGKGNPKNDGGGALPPSAGGDLDELNGEDPFKLTPDGERLIVDPRDGTQTAGTIVRDDTRTIIRDNGTGSAFDGEFYSGPAVPGAYIVEDAGSVGYVSYDSLGPSVSTDYGPSRVIQPDPDYVHVRPQDQEISSAALTGGYDPNPETGVAELVYTDFQDDLIMSNLRTLAAGWGQYRGQPMDLGPSIREMKVEPQDGSNQIVLMVKIQADGVYGGQPLANGQNLYRVELEGTYSRRGRRITLRQISNPAEDGGYRFQAYVTCMDIEHGSCDTAIVAVEQISEHNEVCKRGLAVYRDIGARLQMPPELFTEVNCGRFPDEYSAAKRFLSYMANTVHSYRVRVRLDVPDECTPTGSQYKIPHMEETRARSWSAANGYAFVHIEGIESDYDYTDPAYFVRSDGSNPAAHLFDNSRDWFRFWGPLNRDTEETIDTFVSQLSFDGSQMPQDASVSREEMFTGMRAMSDEIKSVTLEGNNSRGLLSLFIEFVDGYDTEIEFLGVAKRILSPEGMRFYPFQGQEPRVITEYPLPFPEEDIPEK